MTTNKPIILNFSDEVKTLFEEKCKVAGWSTEEALFIFMDGINKGAVDLADIVCAVGRCIEYEIKHI